MNQRFGTACGVRQQTFDLALLRDKSSYSSLWRSGTTSRMPLRGSSSERGSGSSPYCGKGGITGGNKLGGSIGLRLVRRARIGIELDGRRRRWRRQLGKVRFQRPKSHRRRRLLWSPGWTLDVGRWTLHVLFSASAIGLDDLSWAFVGQEIRKQEKEKRPTLNVQRPTSN